MRRPHRRQTGRIGHEEDTIQPYKVKGGNTQMNQKFVEKWGTEAYKEYDSDIEGFYKKGKRKYL